MRRVLLGDLMAGARCLASAAPADQPHLARRLIAEADAAHRYMKRYGRAHPHWGIGSVESRANGMVPIAQRAGIDLGDGRILAALALLAGALAQRRANLALPP